jgi:hypothetical protein
MTLSYEGKYDVAVKEGDNYLITGNKKYTQSSTAYKFQVTNRGIVTGEPQFDTEEFVIVFELI